MSAYDLNQVLHDCRSARLRAIPQAGPVLLSAGCSGTWYFDWITERIGEVRRHVGIEFYTPRPESLPANVEWIANTVGAMHDVADNSVDTVFSGQNLEHLWPEETAGFLVESWRVLKAGGLLVVDSPNRLVTERLGWSHPEHTIEVTPDEARRLAELAGFEVEALHGIWLCADPATGKPWPLDPNEVLPGWTFVERVAAASSLPDHSFIWWLEARRTDRAPDAAGVRSFIESIFATAWPERQTRFSSQVGRRGQEHGRSLISTTPEEAGAVVFGPYVPLPAGDYLAKVSLRATDVERPDETVRIDVVGHEGREIVVRNVPVTELAGDLTEVTCAFSLPALEFGMQARVFAPGGSAIHVVVPIIMEPVPRP